MMSLKLSPAQQQVVDFSGNVASVIGSPGSGKTSCLKARFLALRSRGFSADEILVISATRESASNLRDELALENQGVSRLPLAKTLASYSFALLAELARNSKKEQPYLLSGSEQDRLFALILEEFDHSLWPKTIDATTASLIGFRSELRDLISVAIEHDITSDKLAALSLEHNVPVWRAAAAIYQSYLDRIGNRLDAAMLLQQAAKALAGLQDYPQALIRPRAILIDDAQELTPAASELIFQLARFSQELLLFGDPDSSTLGFRASDPRAMTALAERIDQAAKTFYLEPLSGLRNPDLARLMAKVSSQIEVAAAGRQRRGLMQPASDNSAVTVKVFRSQSDELAELASALRKRHLYDRISWSSLAVVARSRGELENLAIKLSAESVPVAVLGSGIAIRTEHASGELLRLAAFCLEPEIDGERISELLLGSFAGFDSFSVARLKRQIRKIMPEAEPDQLLVEVYLKPELLKLARGTEAKKAKKFFDLIHRVSSKVSEEYSAQLLLWDLAQGSGVMANWREQSRGLSELSLQASRNLDALLALFASAARFSEREPTATAKSYVFDQLQRDIPEDSLALLSQSDRVVLTTPAGLIGKRFEFVALPGLTEGIWPNLKPRSSLLGARLLDQLAAGNSNQLRGELTGELRMLYKAIGSASDGLWVSSVDSEDEQISQFVSLLNGDIPQTETRVQPRLTLRSLVGTLRRELLAENSPDAKLALARLALAKVPGAHPDNWYGLNDVSTSEMLTATGEQLVIRPSQLANYLKCPLHWFLESHGGASGTFSASLGTLIHEVLQQAADSDLVSLKQLTDSRWHTLEFEADWLESLSKRKAYRMLGLLADYLSDFEKSGGEVLAREASFEFQLASVVIRGQLDRIERLSDGSVLVVDLKTSRSAPSEAETMANPQLGLYQLAVLNSAFDIDASKLSGAKLVVIGGDKLTVRSQPVMDEEAKAGFEKLLETAQLEMSSNYFIAQLSNHCRNDREYGSCQLQLTKAVSYVG